MVPRLPGHGAVPRIYDTATRQLVEARPIAVAGLYVCGITPYDATHSHGTNMEGKLQVIE